MHIYFLTITYGSSGQDHNIMAKVSWSDCCTKRNVGGLHLVDLKDAFNALLNKWNVKALEPKDSNLKYRMCKAILCLERLALHM
jgi:hypothetical protein